MGAVEEHQIGRGEPSSRHPGPDTARGRALPSGPVTSGWLPTVAGMTDPVQFTLTMRTHLEVTDPDALLAWAAREVGRTTHGRSALHKELSLALARDVPEALRWAYTADPDREPPGVVLVTGLVAVE